MARYGKASQSSVKRAMEEYKKGELKSGKSEQTVTSRKQAIAIGLSEAREKGDKVPAAPQKKASATKAAPKRKATAKRSTSKK